MKIRKENVIMAKKMTKREMYNQLLSKYELTNEEVKFIQHELELLDKKNSKGEKKLTPTQVANQKIKEAILDGMAYGTEYTITDLMKSIPACAEAQLSNQKVSALVRQLIAENKVIRTEKKGKAYFVLAD